jgi:hypothetical protein
MARTDDYFTIRDAQITFLNFAGKESDYNPAGRRNFSIVLSEDEAEAMKNDGWAVKARPPRMPDGDWLYHLPVAVSYKGRSNPILFMVTSKGKTELDEETAGLLDDVIVDRADLTIRAYNWEVQGKKGVKAYLNEIYATLYESPLALEYDRIPDAADWRPDRLELESGDYGQRPEPLAIDSRETNENTVDGEVLYGTRSMVKSCTTPTKKSNSDGHVGVHRRLHEHARRYRIRRANCRRVQESTPTG